MIVLNVLYQMKETTTAEAFLDELNALQLPAACRAESGNICYDYYYPADGSHTLLLLEKWKDVASLNLHQQMPHFTQIGTVKEKHVSHTVITKSYIED